MRHLKKFLVDADGDNATNVIQAAIATAKRMGAELTLVSVVPPAETQVRISSKLIGLDQVQKMMVEQRQSQLETLAAQSGENINTRVLVGDPTTPIIQLVCDEDYDLLIKAPAPCHGLREQLFGGADMRLIRACPCTVCIARPKLDSNSESSGKIVAAVEYDYGNEYKANLNQSILDGVAFAATFDPSITEVDIVYAWSVYGESFLRSERRPDLIEELDRITEAEEARSREWLAALVNRFRDGLDDHYADRFKPNTKLLHGDPVQVIPEYVQQVNADLLTLGTRSRSGVTGMLVGNTAEAILTRVSCSVVVQKPIGFQAPKLS
ncbi:Universal stress protein E [Planctomycetes bacterium CA13]|uniref:Universal stress protein E n=1 Tax=Novipirellula herctigrandis TaxID=2527986 RepID=A0A5C5ZAZ7_9BACT|nr:Universal stress protein E [Planctomycetes bacterium CA13]